MGAPSPLGHNQGSKSRLSATPFSYCRRCFEVLVLPSCLMAKLQGFDRTTRPKSAHPLPPRS
ncbi:MAG: hypothetical protein E7527_03635 [Ruminococcaceae bacterium]|nr:hypothetical protein [Oscillospiraceae bacterium]